MNLNIPATSMTPSAIYHESIKTLEIAGQSYPGDTIPFYRRIEKEIADYLIASGAPITIVFKLDYFNTSSSKCILDILEVLERAHIQNGNIAIVWYYSEGDEDMLESGEDFALEVNIPFKIVSLPR